MDYELICVNCPWTFETNDASRAATAASVHSKEYDHAVVDDAEGD